MLSGENNKMNVDSFKSGSNNIVTAGGDSTINAGDTTEGCSGGDCDGTTPESGMCTGSLSPLPITHYEDGKPFVSPGCSCESYQTGGSSCTDL